MAWLHAAPDNEPKKDEKPKPSRFEIYRDTRIAEVPELGAYRYIFDLLQKIGLYGSGMSGPVPISWSEIAAWQNANGVTLTPAELDIIKQLSADYCGQYHKSSDPQEMPPAAIALDGSDYDRQYVAETMQKRKR